MKITLGYNVKKSPEQALIEMSILDGVTYYKTGSFV